MRPQANFFMVLPHPYDRCTCGHLYRDHGSNGPLTCDSITGDGVFCSCEVYTVADLQAAPEIRQPSSGGGE